MQGIDGFQDGLKLKLQYPVTFHPFSTAVRIEALVHKTFSLGIFGYGG
jgi:hypothetical protein